mgnify:FL=1
MDKVKKFIKEKWEVMPMHYKAGVGIAIVIAIIFIAT